MSQPPVTAPGWYGKLASLGDFASRRLASAWVQSCDGWLSACVASSREQLGEAWLAAYLGAPLWRFAWAPGVVDAQWWFGVLMPSCDNVGRYFPLIVAAGRPAAPQDRFALDHLELWWSGAALAALGTLAEGIDVNRFEQALADLPPWPGTRNVHGWASAPLVHEHTLPAGAALTDIVHGLAAGQLLQQLQGCSFWWPWRPQDTAGSGRCRIVAGLPAPQEFTLFLGPAP